MVLKFEHVLLGGGMVLAIIGHLGDGTATQEVIFGLGVMVSLVGLGWQVRDEKYQAFQ